MAEIYEDGDCKSVCLIYLTSNTLTWFQVDAEEYLGNLQMRNKYPHIPFFYKELSKIVREGNYDHSGLCSLPCTTSPDDPSKMCSTTHCPWWLPEHITSPDFPTGTFDIDACMRDFSVNVRIYLPINLLVISERYPSRLDKLAAYRPLLPILQTGGILIFMRPDK